MEGQWSARDQYIFRERGRERETGLTQGIKNLDQIDMSTVWEGGSRGERGEMENNAVCVRKEETEMQGRGTEMTQETRPQRRFEAKSHETDGTGGRDGEEERHMKRRGTSGRVAGHY